MPKANSMFVACDVKGTRYDFDSLLRMRSLVFLLLGLSRVLNVIAAPSWSFVDGTVSIHSKGASAEAEKQQ